MSRPRLDNSERRVPTFQAPAPAASVNMSLSGNGSLSARIAPASGDRSSPPPDVDALRIALSKQTQPTADEITTYFSTRYVEVLILNLRGDLKLNDLIALANTDNRNDVLDHPGFRACIKLDLSHSSFGSFKKCYDAVLHPTTNKPLNVVAKQTIYTNTDNRVTVHPSRDQGIRLANELVCLAWAKALGRLVDDYIRQVVQKKAEGWKPRVARPAVHFVSAALAISQGQERAAAIYMVEEKIGGVFHKFINNASAKISDSLPSYLQEVALFLAFSQHAQYHLTNKQVFVSDFQGGYENAESDVILLTDPQIMTSPDLGRIFAEGNVRKSFQAFPEQHECNVFCEDFELKPLTGK
ncbi:hypothetical protein HMN09_00465800 [Mycena chlorophos]|uniref:Alpha-type protein kinase domain-containing protein n=1 Tax=Mycena chlorophos TaxID=658473 RepID=A0A8H6TGK4_MYCCL|nr:hypothetical protein HMN09_00465800 [Mycena chlorophos]